MNTIFDIFRNITRFDIQSYFEDFSDFILSDYQKLINYYQNGSDIDADTITLVNDLYSRMLQLNDLFNVYESRLSSETSEVWEILDNFETTKVTLLTVLNLSRWMRSTKNVLRSNSVDRDFILRQGQNFEQLASEVGYSDFINDWSKIAINNDIKEEDYSFEGGNKLKISFVNNLSFFINSVIDSVSGQKIYGKDIDLNFVFEDEDLKTLEYHDTIVQQTQILVGLVKGSVPEFPLDGINKGILGGNVNAIQYPILLRQQSAVFEKDDRYKSISISKFEVNNESLIVDLQITTKLNDVLNEQLVLQQ